MASNNKQGGGSKAGGHDHQDQEIDPKFEWLDNANNFLLRLTLTGFKKEDFRVQVDGTGKLTVRGQRSSAGAGAGNKQHNIRFHKVFQLPSNANIEDITGRFEANVLTITVPKRPASSATVQDIKQQQQHKDDEAARKKKQQLQEEEDAKKKKLQEEEEAKKKRQLQEEEEAKKKKLIQEEEEARKKKKLQEEDDEARRKKKMEEELQLGRKKKLQEEEEDESRKKKAQQQKKEEEEHYIIAKKRSGSQQEQKNVVDREESMVEKVKRRAEEERAKAAAAAEERTATALNGWRERVAEELERIGEMRWVDGAVETVRKNKEVIATAVAAFSIGFFLSQKIFCRTR
uniref:SHSP domain-containing protein n=1 Tax=Leersia perrieri TaxID=77586 RepID=A0A0D9WKH9_9ORYZ